MSTPTMVCVRNGLLDVSKYAFGLPLYSFYLVTSRIQKGSRGAIAIGVILGWICVLLSTWMCLFHPPEISLVDVRVLRLNLIVVFLFVGMLIHVKAEHDNLF